MNLMNTRPRQGQAGFRGIYWQSNARWYSSMQVTGETPSQTTRGSGSPGKRKAPLKSPSRPKMGRLAPSPFALA